MKTPLNASASSVAASAKLVDTNTPGGRSCAEPPHNPVAAGAKPVDTNTPGGQPPAGHRAESSGAPDSVEPHPKQSGRRTPCGDKDVRTTMIYTHVQKNGTTSIETPLTRTRRQQQSMNSLIQKYAGIASEVFGKVKGFMLQFSRMQPAAQ